MNFRCNKDAVVKFKFRVVFFLKVRTDMLIMIRSAIRIRFTITWAAGKPMVR